jgi:hypothetical protein
MTKEEQGYFMTDNEKYAIIGRVSTEYARARNHLTALREEAARLCKMYQELGLALTRPEWTVFDDEPIPAGIVTYQGFKPNDRGFRSSEIDGSGLRVLCNEIRKAMLDLSDLDEKKRALGI